MRIATVQNPRARIRERSLLPTTCSEGVNERFGLIWSDRVNLRDLWVCFVVAFVVSRRQSEQQSEQF